MLAKRHCVSTSNLYQYTSILFKIPVIYITIYKPWFLCHLFLETLHFRIKIDRNDIKRVIQSHQHKGFCSVMASDAQFLVWNMVTTNCTEQSFTWEANSQSLIKEYPTFYGTWFIIELRVASHWYLSWASCIQSTTPSILILSSHHCLSLLSGLIHSGFLTEILYTFLTFPKLAACSPISFSLIRSLK
jgi:hypothetical protein